MLADQAQTIAAERVSISWSVTMQAEVLAIVGKG